MPSAKPPRSTPPFRPGSRYLLAVLLAWLLPGGGHWLLGYRVRAALIATTLLGAFWFSEIVLAERMAITWEVHPVFFGLEVGNGFSTLAANVLWGDPAHPDQTWEIKRDLPEHLNLGILFCSITGLLNVLVVLHVLDPKTWTGENRERDRDPVPGGEEGSPREGSS